VSCKAMRYKIDGKDILAFDIPLSPHRPVAIKSNGEVYIRTGSGDTLATDLEVDAIVRDASFGAKSEMEVPGSGFNDINLDSIASYRSYLRDFNRPLSFPTLDDEEFCRKLNIVLSSGKLSYGSLNGHLSTGID
uniref:AlbA family DNA-binding domain-containing protein n=1 Tax=uncultured Muribaculum sp. TaxID=1918613 RepID=UPI0025B6E4CD